MQVSLAVKIAFFSTITWVILVIGVGVTGSEGAVRSGLDWLALVVTIVLPVVLIWMAAFAADALSILHSEAASLRLVVDSLRRDAAHTSKVRAEAHDDLPQVNVLPQTVAPTGGGRRAGGASNPVPLTAEQLILSLNFPDSPDDQPAVAALQAALASPDLARVIRASQDVITLLAAQGIFMDDQPLHLPEADLWRRFVEGSRREAMAGLARAMEEAGLGPVLHDLVRGDQILQDAVQHFLRQYDNMLQREAPGLHDAELVALSDTRSGRAFMLLAHAARLKRRSDPVPDAETGSDADGGDGP